MASKLWTFTTNQTFHFTGSDYEGGSPTGSTTASIECWGAGGHGNKNGTGGSGGAYASKMVILSSGSYTIVVGQATATDGGQTYVSSSNGALVVAAGGKMDGTVSHQLAASSGSTVYVGGVGGANFTGYSAYNGGGGGGCAGQNGNGQDGQSGFYSTADAPASGGRYNNTGVERFGGNGAFYYAGPGVNQVYAASTGSMPGCGGGGGYDYPQGGDSSAAGGAGYVTIWINDAF